MSTSNNVASGAMFLAGKQILHTGAGLTELHQMAELADATLLGR